MSRRGMTLVETMLAIGMTALVGAGISGMMHVLSNDVAMQHGVRAGVTRAALIQSRASAYIGRSRCLLDLEDNRCVLWLEDGDADDAVRASEVRWMQWSDDTGEAALFWLSGDDALMPVYDTPEQTDWWAQLDTLARVNGIKRGTLTLANAVKWMQFADAHNSAPIQRRRDAMQRQRVEIAFDLQLGDGARSHHVGETIRLHRPPCGEAAP